MKVTVEFDSVQDAQDALKALSVAKSAASVPQAIKPVNVPAQATAAPKPVPAPANIKATPAPAPAPATKAKAAPAPAPATKAKAAPAPAPAPTKAKAVPYEAPEQEGEISLDEIKTKQQEVIGVNKEGLKELFKATGIRSLADLPVEKYDEYYQGLCALVEPEEEAPEQEEEEFNFDA